MPLTQKDVGYDPIKNFAPVSLVSIAPLTLVVHSSVPASNVKELIAYARTLPNGLDYGSAGAGSLGNLASELFGKEAGIKLVHVPYKGQGPSTHGGDERRGEDAAHQLVGYAGCGGESRQAEAARGLDRQALAADARHTDHQPVAARLRERRVVRHPGAGRHARAGDRQAEWAIREVLADPDCRRSSPATVAWQRPARRKNSAP